MDRFTRGLIAGIVGAVAMNLWTVIAVNILNWQIIRFIDWAGVILYGELPRTHLEGFFALVIQLLWGGLLGIIFSFILPHITSRAYLIKGVYFGIIAGFIIFAVPTIFQMPLLGKLSFITVLSNLIGGTIWGLTTAQTLHWLDSTQRVKL